MEIPETLNGYTVIRTLDGPREVPTGIAPYSIIIGHAPNRYGARYVAAKVTEQSLQCGEWLQGHYRDTLTGAVLVARSLRFAGSA